MLKDFKAFLLRGNIMDLAIAVILGGALNGLVASLTKNVLNPLLGLFVGQANFARLVFTVGSAKFTVGSFLNDIINFIILAFIVFLIMKGINKFRQPAQTAGPSQEERYLEEIRDLLAAKQNQK